MSDQGTIRVLLCDDHDTIRGLVRTMLDNEPDIAVVVEARDAVGLLRESALEQPDVIVLDGRLGDEHGFEFIAQLLEGSPASKVLMFSSEADRAYQRRALELGARGYLLKDSAEQLAEALRRVVEGGVYLDPRFRLSTAV